MCHWVHEPDRSRNLVGEQPAKPTFTGKRLAGAVGAALVALVAVAALLMPSSTPAVSEERGAAIAPVASSRVTEPSGPVVEQTAGAFDDDVPSAPVAHSTMRAAGHCDHEL